MARNLRLQLRKIDDDCVSVRWFDDHDGDLGYQIALEQIAQAAASVREKLNKMIQQYIRDPKSSQTGTTMRNLLDAGHDLFAALFLATSDPGQADRARQIYTEFDAEGPLSLALKVDPVLSYPFALAVPFDDDLDAVVAAPASANTAFWGLRHNLSISAFGAGISRGKAFDLTQYRAMAGVNRAVFNMASDSMTEIHERRILDVMRQHWGSGLTFTVRDFIAASKEAGGDSAAKLRIAYLYGHAAGDRLQLAADDEISAATLATRLGDNANRAERQQTFLFLNGCDTAGEGERFAFTDLLRYPNISGLIGTEVRVPDRFAFRFGLAFFQLVVCEGQTFREAINNLRREHLPISLIYTLYAPDALSLVPNPDAELPALGALPKVNFSEGKVKCEP
jgi:hypothetical protein